MTRGAPSRLSTIKLPTRAVRPVTLAQCGDCHEWIAVRDGHLAGHYASGTELCTGSSTPVSATPTTKGAA